MCTTATAFWWSCARRWARATDGGRRCAVQRGWFDVADGKAAFSRSRWTARRPAGPSMPAAGRASVPASAGIRGRSAPGRRSHGPPRWRPGAGHHRPPEPGPLGAPARGAPVAWGLAGCGADQPLQRAFRHAQRPRGGPHGRGLRQGVQCLLHARVAPREVGQRRVHAGGGLGRIAGQVDGLHPLQQRVGIHPHAGMQPKAQPILAGAGGHAIGLLRQMRHRPVHGTVCVDLHDEVAAPVGQHAGHAGFGALVLPAFQHRGR